MALRNLNKAAEFTATVEAGLKAKPGDADLEKLLYVYCMKQGQAVQKSGKIADAEELYKDVLIVSNPKYKENALYSLGAMYYNEGAKILAAATDPAKYEAEKDKADVQMKKAKEYMEQGHFGVYNMLPKFQAAVEFVEEREGRTALITSYDKINDALKGKTGTTIHA